MSDKKDCKECHGTGRIYWDANHGDPIYTPCTACKGKGHKQEVEV